jgi:ABC-2 type transport system permease protein
MRNLLLIAKREYLEQIRGRAFRLSTILIPVLFVGVAGMITLSGKNTAVGKHLVIASNDAKLAAGIKTQVDEQKELQASVELFTPGANGDVSDLKQKLVAKSIDGYLSVNTQADGTVKAMYSSQSSGDIALTQILKSAMNTALVNERLGKRGMQQSEIDATLNEIPIETQKIDSKGEISSSSGWIAFFKGYFMALLLSMTTMIYGMNVARSIIQEKTSRIFEVMLASAKSSDMLAGKLVGVGAVGLTQIAIWGVGVTVLAGTPMAAAMMSGKFNIHFTWQEGLLFPLYFLLGYLLYSSLFSGLAATCETEQELQMYTPLAAIPIWLGFSLIFLVINDPNSIWSLAASLFPLTAPIIMIMRMGAEMPPVWQFAASIALMLLSIWGALWVSARLYRVGILMYGKRATLPEILRWIRYS